MEKLIQGTMENYDVMVDDGGMIYYLLFKEGAMSTGEIVSDFLAGYDGKCKEDEIDVVSRDDVEDD